MSTISAGLVKVNNLSVVSTDASIISATNFDFQNLNVDGNLSVNGGVSLGNSVTLGGVQIATLNDVSGGLALKANITDLNNGLALKANVTQLNLKANVTDVKRKYLDHLFNTK